MNSNTKYVNDLNQKIIQHHIQQKINYKPHFPDINLMNDTITDYDHFPYKRWYRGKYYLSYPVIAEREAGYRPINNNCYAQCLANYLEPY